MKASEFRKLIREEISKVLNEEWSNKLTIGANRWAGRKPEIKRDPNGDLFIFFSKDLSDGQFTNVMARQNVFVMVIQPLNDKILLKVGYGSEDDQGEKRYLASTGESLTTSAEELKADPAGVAKKFAALFATNRIIFNRNFLPYNNKVTFKFENDLAKPALELIKFAIKNIK